MTHREPQRGRLPHRTRGSRQARHGARLGRAGRLPGDARLLHGGAPAARDHRAADRRRAGPPTSRPPSWSAARSPAASRPRHAADDRRASPPTPGSRPRRSPLRGGGRTARATRLAGARPAGRPDGRGDPRARPGLGLASQPARTRRRRDRDPRHPHRAAAGPAPRLTGYDLICLTSANGVHELFERLQPRARRARLAGARVAAIGPGTARALREHGVIADVVPERFVAEGLVEALARHPGAAVPSSRAPRRPATCCPMGCALGARRSMWSRSTRRSPSRSSPSSRRWSRADYLTFTSSSTVRFFLARPARPVSATRLVSIGPVTSATLREHGREPDVEAARHDIDGLLEAIVADAAASRIGDQTLPMARPAVITFLLGLRPRRRLRRRLPRGDRQALPARHGSSTSATACRATTSARARSRWRRRCPICRSACIWRWSIPTSGPSAAPSPCASPTVGVLVGPDNGLLMAAARERGAGSRRLTSRARGSSRADQRDVPRPRHFAPVAAAVADGGSLAAVGEPLDPADLVRLELPVAQMRRRERSSPMSATSTASATCRSTRAMRSWPTRASSSGARCGDRGRPSAASPLRTRGPSPTWGRVSCCSTRTPGAGSQLAVSHGDAAQRLGVAVGDELTIRPQ